LLLYWFYLMEGDGTPFAGLDHVLVDEYQDTNTLQAEIRPGMSKVIAHDRGRRRRAGDLRFSWGHGAEYPRFSESV